MEPYDIQVPYIVIEKHHKLIYENKDAYNVDEIWSHRIWLIVLGIFISWIFGIIFLSFEWEAEQFKIIKFKYCIWSMVPILGALCLWRYIYKLKKTYKEVYGHDLKRVIRCNCRWEEYGYLD